MLGDPPVLDDQKSQQEVSLVLNNILDDSTNGKSIYFMLDDSKQEAIRKLYVEAKRQVLAIVRVQTGPSLLQVLETPASEKQITACSQFVQTEAEQFSKMSNSSISQTSPHSPFASSLNLQSPFSSSQNISGGTSSNSLLALRKSDGTLMTLPQLKAKALENLSLLEHQGIVTRTNGYQDMTNALAKVLFPITQ